MDGLNGAPHGAFCHCFNLVIFLSSHTHSSRHLMTSNLLPFSVPSGNLVARSLGYLLVLVVVVFCSWAIAQDADTRSTGDFSAVGVPTSPSMQDDCSPGPLITESPPPGTEQQNPPYALIVKRSTDPAGSPNLLRQSG